VGGVVERRDVLVGRVSDHQRHALVGLGRRAGQRKGHPDDGRKTSANREHDKPWRTSLGEQAFEDKSWRRRKSTFEQAASNEAIVSPSIPQQ